MGVIYAGEYRKIGERWRVRRNGVALHPGPAFALRKHSPAGFSWGYCGSGPAQLALALLLDVVGEEKALAWYQDFKAEVVAGWPQEGGWVLTEEAIRLWVESHEENPPLLRADEGERGRSDGDQ